MLRFITLSCFVFLTLAANAQIPDFISVKKRNGITIKNYYADISISFIATDGRKYDALIDRIANDSIYLRYFTVAPYTNVIGTISYDTVTTYILQMHYKNIRHVLTPKAKYRNHYLGELGRYAAIGGLGYTFLNLFNGITQHAKPLLDSRNSRNVAIATGVGGIGLFLNRKLRNGGKSNRYNIEYINMSLQPSK